MDRCTRVHSAATAVVSAAAAADPVAAGEFAANLAAVLVTPSLLQAGRGSAWERNRRYNCNYPLRMLF